MKKSLFNHRVLACALVSISLLCCDGEDPSPINDNPVVGEPIVTEVGSPNGTASSASIGTAGGVLKSADGYLTVTIPAGALSTTTKLFPEFFMMTNKAWATIVKRLTRIPSKVSSGWYE